MPKEGAPEAVVYQIRLEGHLDARWAEWFEGLTITVDNGNTVLTGAVTDQAALHGLLKKVRDLGMPLVSVNRVEGGKTDGGEDGERSGKGDGI